MFEDRLANFISFSLYISLKGNKLIHALRFHRIIKTGRGGGSCELPESPLDPPLKNRCVGKDMQLHTNSVSKKVRQQIKGYTLRY